MTTTTETKPTKPMTPAKAISSIDKLRERADAAHVKLEERLHADEGEILEQLDTADRARVSQFVGTREER